jgi:4-hydroxybutyryl-CoA dehydratase / vinylacetyl-CoA-Delta-isomerase
MAIKTPDQLAKRLKRRKADFRYRGKPVVDPTEHPSFIPTYLSWAYWVYQAAFDKETAETMIARPDLNGEDSHVFWHMATNADDLMQNLDAARLLAERSPLAGYASIGRDELQALLMVTHQIDKSKGTSFHKRTLEYCKRFQREQLMTAAAVTDVKGHRMKRPGEQDDPDVYVHVVERRSDGIVVRGAKAHTSGSVVCEDLVVIPTRVMLESEADYAVAFAIPVDTPGITLIARPFNDSSVDNGEGPISSHDELAETLTIFNDVFVPNERVFMDGQWDYAGEVAHQFSNVNRQGYLGAESGKLRLFIGAAKRIAELNGTDNVSHIREKISQLIRLERSIWALGVAASIESLRHESGYQVPDPVLTNAGKHLCTEGHFLATRLLLDVAGGAVTTTPLFEDMQADDVRPLVEKYLRGADSGNAWERVKVFKLIRDLAASEYCGYWNTEILHGSGSPAAEVLAMYRETDLERYKQLVERALTGRAAIMPKAATV